MKKGMYVVKAVRTSNSDEKRRPSRKTDNTHNQDREAWLTYCMREDMAETNCDIYRRGER